VLRFRAPDAGAQSARLGLASSAFTNGLQEISDLVVPPGAVLQGLDLPIDPNGVVYRSIQRTPISGASLTLLNAGSQTALPASCFDDPVQQGQVTRGDGYYKFDLNFTDAACPSGGNYLIAIVPPGPAFTPGYSTVIPPISGPATPPLDVPACPGGANDAVPSTAAHCESAPSELLPPASLPPRSAGTNYHVHLLLSDAQVPGSSQIFNNHLPLDPLLEEVVGIRKTTPLVNVIRGQQVPYEITVTTDEGVVIPDLSVVDRLPGGFSYVDGSARVDNGDTDLQIDPTRNGRELTWTDVGTGVSGILRIRMLLVVGAGVSEGEFVNRAQAFSSITGQPLSGEASVTVRVTADPTFDCTDVLGKVFDDANDNGVQDQRERGLAGVRVATARGLVATTDRYGRFHITCAVVPREDRGSNFILKLDDRTLPSGYRMTTRETQVQRATRGKALVFHFGAAIQRVIGLDVADPVFEPGTDEMRLHWKPRIGLLVAELAKAPAILRVSYLGDVEDAGLVARRLEALERAIRAAWSGPETPERYELTIESAVYWRRGGPPDRSRPSGEERGAWEKLESLLPSVDAGPPALGASPGSAAQRQLWGDEPSRRWSQDPAALERMRGDRVEQQQVVKQQPKTVKLRNIVPPIRFESGVATIPPSYVEKLRRTLDEMSHLHNVRLHLVGHADAEPLSPTLSRLYGDNQGLSEERAGEVAEYLQRALGLPPESISFAWAGDTEPIASNASPEGRAQNRRVEVEVWYDESEPKLAVEDVVVPDEIKRFKVCRTETVCKLRYLEGHERRARIRNLIPPLHYGEEFVEVPDDFVRQVEQALQNLRGEQNVTVKFIGFTDGAPLTGRSERIYGNHLALSKARAHRVALAVKDALDLPTASIASDGQGSGRPLAPNDTERGRALNRRVEVEFWHDDALQELPDDPQPCPGEAGAEVVTRVYEPSWGAIASLPIEDGDAQVPAGYTDTLRRAMADVADKTHVRLRFVGYTRDETLDRRTAAVYGDDIGLSAARARRTMEKLRAEMGLAAAQVEHEGRGYVHANDVVNAGFVQADTSYVAVQVVYDELAALDDYDGVEVTRITRELFPKEPLALNLMRITVDGEPIDDPGRSVADIQRCTDVALEGADIRFRFDDLETVPRLSVTSEPAAAPVSTDGARTGAVRFRMYTNYWPFITRSEVRIFEQAQSAAAAPLAVVPIGADGTVEWQPPAESFEGPVRERKFVLRAYDAEGRFDETSPQSLWQVYREPAPAPAPAAPGQQDPLLAGYGETGRLARNIPLGSTGTVQVHGSGIPPEHSVWLAGSPVPVDAHGSFAAEVVLPAGLHTVEVAVLDASGNGELFLRDLAFEKSDWFYVALADLTVAHDFKGGPPSALEGNHAPYDEDSYADGRLAFYVNGKFGEGWKLTASADTREEPVQDLFTNFLDKSPDALFRRIDPDYHYPTFGDDGTVDEMAPTQGKFFAKLQKDESHAMWGNFKVGYFDNELAQVDRGLYGGNVHYETLGTTSFGEERVAVDGFAAEPGTVQSREEFRGTGGSLYYLKHQDLLIGSERLRVELRDKDSGLVSSVVYLRPTLDYDIDYLQGRVLLTEPLAATVEDGLLVRNEGLSGNDAFLVVQYEYTPSFDELNALAAGGQGHVWITDFLKLGLTASKNDGTGDNSTLYGGDMTLRATSDSWLKLQAGRSEGLVSTTLASEDGGFLFFGPAVETLAESDANAYRADVSFAVQDWIEVGRGRVHVYAQNLEAGYSAPGQDALTDTENYGASLQVPITDQLDVTAKADWQRQDDGLEIRAEEVDLGYQLTPGWRLGAGVRNELREDDSDVEATTQEEGERTDAVAQIGYDAKGRWRAYTFGQGTLAKDGDRDANHRGGVGGAFRLTDKLLLEGETSYGNLGPAVRLGTTFQQTEETRRYMSYAYENERGYDGLHERTGNLISGMRTRLSDSSSVFVEDRYKHGDYSTGVARAVGITLAPSDRWSMTGHWELGNLFNRETNQETKRRAGGALVGYGFDRLQLSGGVEYRYDDSEQADGSWTDRTTWLFRNTARFQLTPDVRLVGKANHSFSDSSEGDFFDGRFTEVVIGSAYRPVWHDRLNVLAKYTYFYNFPTADQVTLKDTPVEFIQKSHVAALDATYDVTENITLGAKYAYRLGQAALDRDDPDFFDNDAHLVIVRGDYRFLKYWEGSAEWRMLDLPDQDERRHGAMATFYQYLGDHFKVGVGYNFTDFSEDLTDLSYDDHGIFFNVVGSM
jgi:flagellar motor protein MotB